MTTDTKSRAHMLYVLGQRLGRASRAHYREAAALSAKDRVATIALVFGGILVIALTSAIAALPGELGSELAPAATFIAMLVVGVGVLQAVWKWGLRAQKHQTAGAAYANLRRDFCLFLLRSPHDNMALAELAKSASDLAQRTEMVERRVWKRTGRYHDADMPLEMIEGLLDKDQPREPAVISAIRYDKRPPS
jgi:hypothetical protein